MPERDMRTQLHQENTREIWRRALASVERKITRPRTIEERATAEAYRRAIDRYDRGDDFSEILDGLTADVPAVFGDASATPKGSAIERLGARSGWAARASR